MAEQTPHTDLAQHDGAPRSPPKAQRCCFGRFSLLPRTRQLLRDDIPLSLGARAFDLLLVLIEGRERVLEKDELMRQVWPATVVGDNNLNVQIATLRKLLGAEAVVTVAGRGYRFGMELRADAPWFDRRRPAAGAPRAIAATPLPDKPSVAVLPFVDLGGEALPAHLADGLSEDITTELSRFRPLFVIARHSANAYRHRAVDVRTVSRELGVRYVVEGSVRQAGRSVRVAAQLIDATSGEHLWAEKYDLPWAERLELQDHLTRAIVAALAPQIEAHACSRARHAPHDGASAYTLAQRGWALACSGATHYDRAPRDAALHCASEALALDPDCMLALRAVAQVQWWQAVHGTADSLAEAVSRGLTAATRAIELDPDDHQARLWYGQLLCLAQRTRDGLDTLRQAQQLNPNCAHALGWLGFHEATSGDASKGVPCAREALRLSPRDPERACLQAALGFAHFAQGDDARAAQLAQTALRDAQDSPMLRLLGTLSWVGLGEIVQAQAAFQTLRQIAPRMAQARLDGHWLAASPRYLRRAQTFLRIAAGMEDPGAAEDLRCDHAGAATRPDRIL